MVLNKKDIADFLHAGHAIQQNKVLPVLSNVCFKGGRAIKTNLREFISMPFITDHDFLIDEQLLKNFINYTTCDTFTIEILPTKIKLTDDNGTVMHCDNVKVNEYPVINQPTGTAFFLNKGFFQQLAVAAKFTGSDSLKPQFEAVYVKGGKIGSTDAWVMYYGNIDTAIPDMIISKAACRLFDAVEVGNGYENDGFYFVINATGTIYGAIKTELRHLDMSVVLPKALPPGVTVNSDEFIRYNSAAVSIIAGKPINAIMHGGVNLELDQQYYNIEFSKYLPTAGLDLKRWKYQPQLLNRILTSLPNRENTWVQGTGVQLYIFNNDYTCVMMGMVDNPQQ